MSPRLKDRLLRIRWQILRMNRRQVLRGLYRITRPTSYPYISGDGFRRLARHVYDETSKHLSPGSIHRRDCVFVATDYVRLFFERIEPGITQPYTLITHNSDVAVDESLTALCSQKTRFWFAQNNSHVHPRVIPIPIGLENLHHMHAGIPQEFNAVRALQTSRKNRILASFSIQTNPQERQPAYETLSRAQTADCPSGWLDQQDYLRTLSEYKFVLSPPGNGLDTHRTWEAMYLGVVPIVKDSSPMRYFQGLGLPLWIVTRWDEVLRVGERDLETKYEELKSGFGCPALFMDYWRRVILGGEPSKVGSGAGNVRREVLA